MPPEAPAAPSPRAAAEPTAAGTPRGARRARRVIAASAAVALLAGAIGGVALLRLSADFDTAQRLAKQGQWDDASAAVSRYLRVWPGDAEARLLAAEMLVRSGDEAGRSEQAALEAIAHLDLIPDDSPRGPEARLRAAGMLLMVLKRPHAAETQVRRVVARDPERLQAHLLLWRILDVTRRSVFAEPTFLDVMRLSPPDQQTANLRHWYLSQFAPAGANLEFDRLVGVVEPTEQPSPLSELERYELFRAAEPDASVHVAAAARVLMRNEESQRAADLLDAFGRESAWADPFFAATRAEVAHTLGDTATFNDVMRHWPEPHLGFEYLKWEGVRLEENADDPAAAAESYRKALEVWPGPIDWQVFFRLSSCLRRTGAFDEAERFRARSDELELLTRDEYHRPLRFALADPTDADAAQRAADFYEAIGRQWEAGLWNEHAASLRRSNATKPVPNALAADPGPPQPLSPKPEPPRRAVTP